MKDHEDLQKDRRIILLPTNLPGVYTLPPIPHGFNPNTASRVDLKRHGFMWRRPEPGDHPALLGAWNAAFSRQWSPENHIIPHMQVQPENGRHHFSLLRPDEPCHDAYSWGGIVCPTPFKNLEGNPTVIGQWVIPTVTHPADDRPAGSIINEPKVRGWDSSSWIGIDGYCPSGSTDVLQAGIEHYVKPKGDGFESVYIAWYEWYIPSADPETRQQFPYIDQTAIPNFVVRPGDTVYCSVQYISHVVGYIWFSNVTTGQYFSITLCPPTGASFNGSSIEWIVEAPSGGWSNPDGAVVPDMTPVTFTNALGCGGGADPVFPSSGTEVYLIEGFGAPSFSVKSKSQVSPEYLGTFTISLESS